MFNIAIELIINTVTDKFRPVIKMIKDVVAGGVLISALNALLIGYIIFVR
ncbi:hypothetical protein B9J78_06070 [bacterium Unc6]|nr:hypothetical protein [bacterium Unc6]